MIEPEKIDLNRFQKLSASPGLIDRPLVVEDTTLKDSRICSWDGLSDILGEQFSDTKIPYLRMCPGTPLGRYCPDDPSGDVIEEYCTIREFMETLSQRGVGSEEALYARTLSIPEYFPGLDELPTTGVFPKSRSPAMDSPYMWIGSGEHLTSLHTDRYPNINWLLSGKKRIWLFSPDQIKYMSPAPISENVYLGLRSSLDPRRVLLDDSWPPNQGGMYYELNPGQAIVIPPYWWHCVESKGRNAAINYWWSDIEEPQFVDIFMAFSSALYAFKALPKTYRHAWREIFSELVFLAESSQDPTRSQTGLDGDQTEFVRELLRNLTIRLGSHIETRCHQLIWERAYCLTERGKVELASAVNTKRETLEVFAKPVTLHEAEERLSQNRKIDERRSFEYSELFYRLTSSGLIFIVDPNDSEY